MKQTVYQTAEVLGVEVSIPDSDPLLTSEQIVEMFDRPQWTPAEFIIQRPNLNLGALAMGITQLTGQACRQVWTTSAVYTARFAYVGYIPFPSGGPVHKDPPLILCFEDSYQAQRFNIASNDFTDFWVRWRRQFHFPGRLPENFVENTMAYMRQALLTPLIDMHPTFIETSYVVSTLYGEIAQGFNVDEV